MIEVERVKPNGLFTNYVFKAIPLAFDESMSYYETLCGLLDYMKNTMIPALNNNADAVIELQGDFADFTTNINQTVTELENFVNNYFDNLDVQEEINNKLDEMVEDGTLPEIIATYLNAKAIFGFDTVADMKASTNLINGSYAETLGYHEKNDGGRALYKIRTITNDDVVDNALIIAMDDETNNLIAELILPGEIDPMIMGAYGDGTHDDTTAVQKAINTNRVVKPSKNHLISSELEIKNSFIMQANNYIILDDSMETIGVSIAKGTQQFNKDYKINVQSNGTITTSIGLYKPRNCKFDLCVTNAGTNGINLNYASDYGNGGNTYDLFVIGNSSGTTEKGIFANSFDSTYNNVVTQDCLVGVYLDRGEFIAKSLHSWISDSLASTLWSNSYVLYVRSYAHMVIDWLYQDSVRYGVGGTGPYGHINYFEFNNTLTNASTTYNNELNVNVSSGSTRLTIDVFANDQTESKRLSYSLASVNNNEFGVVLKNGVNSSSSAVDDFMPFNDCNNAPQIGSYLVTYNITNLPVEQGGTLICEVTGSNYMQTFISNNYGSTGFMFKRMRKNSEDTWSSWYRYTPNNA